MDIATLKQNALSNDYNNSLYLTAANDNIEVLSTLIKFLFVQKKIINILGRIFVLATKQDNLKVINNILIAWETLANTYKFNYQTLNKINKIKLNSIIMAAKTNKKDLAIKLISNIDINYLFNDNTILEVILRANLDKNLTTALAKILIDRAININHIFLQGICSTLITAIYYNQVEVVSYLLQHNIDKNYLTPQKINALMIAAAFDYSDIAELLILHNANIALANNFGDTSLNIAILHNSNNVINKFIELSMQNKINYIFIGQHLPFALLHKKTNVIKSICDLLISKATATNSQQLIEAVNRYIYHNLWVNLLIPENIANTDFFEFLLAQGAYLNYYYFNNQTESPLMLATQYNNIAAINLIYKYSYSPQQISNHGLTNGYTPLMLSVVTGNNHITQTLLNNQANINAVTNQGLSALMLACAKPYSPQQKDIVQQLLYNNANVNQTTVQNHTALTFAVLNDNVDAVTQLLQQNANPNIACCKKYPALTLAAQQGNLAITNLLLKNGCQINLPLRAQGYRALVVAIHYGHTAIIKALLDHKASHDFTIKKMYLSLTYTAKAYETANIYKMTQQSTKHNKFTPYNGSTYTPLLLARNANNTEIITLIEQAKTKNTC